MLSHLSSTLGSNYSLSSHLGTITHRIVHGADTPQPAVVTKGHQSRLRRMEALTAFAPLHNHVAVSVVKGCLSHLPSARNLLYFDTTFHHSLPEHVYTYPVPPTAAGQGLPGGMPFRKYGFHGLSYAYITKRVASFLGRSSSEVNLIVAHLGSGASVCAIANGKSVDTSMGLTPLEGLPGSSRSGSIDPSLPYHLIPPSSTRKEGLTTEFAGMEMARAEYVLNKESGLGAVAGIGDFGEITKRMNASGKEEGEEKRKAKLAFDLFEDRVAGYVGNYYCASASPPLPFFPPPFYLLSLTFFPLLFPVLFLFWTVKLAPLGGVDALVFSGGIGEKSSELRDALADRFEGTPLAMRADRTGGEEGQAGGKEQAGVHDIAEEEKRGGKQGVRWLVCEVSQIPGRSCFFSVFGSLVLWFFGSSSVFFFSFFSVLFVAL